MDDDFEIVEAPINHERKKYERKNAKFSSISSSTSSSNMSAQLHKCQDCSRSFKDVNNYKEHRFQEHRITGYANVRKCSLCSYATLLKSKYDCHMRCHLNNKVIKCNKCDYSTINIRHMSRHERMHMSLNKIGVLDESKSVQTSSLFNTPTTNQHTNLKNSNDDNEVKNRKKLSKLKRIQKQMFKSKHVKSELLGKMNKKKLKTFLMANKDNLIHKIENRLPKIDNSNDKAQYNLNKARKSYSADIEKCLDDEKEQRNPDMTQTRLHPFHYDLLKNYIDILNQNKNTTNQHNNKQVFASKDEKPTTSSYFPTSLYVNNSNNNEMNHYNNNNHHFYHQSPPDGQHLLTVPSHSSNVITPPSSSSSIVSSPLSEHHQSHGNRNLNNTFFYPNQSVDQNINLPSNLLNNNNNNKLSNMLTNLNPNFSLHDINADNQLKLQELKCNNQLLSSQLPTNLICNLNKQSFPNLNPRCYESNNENRPLTNHFFANSKPSIHSYEYNRFSLQCNNPEKERNKCEPNGQACVHKAELTCLRKNLFLMFANSMPHVISLFNLDPNNIENTTQIDKTISCLVQNQKF